MKPAHKVTKLYLKQSQEKGSSSLGISTTSLNPNPKLKKHYFWIYHYKMPYSSAQEVFFKDEHRLSLTKAMNLMKQLEKDNIPYAYVNTAYHRLGTKVFDYKKLKEKYPDIEFAIAYDDDRDEACEELNGHR